MARRGRYEADDWSPSNLRLHLDQLRRRGLSFDEAWPWAKAKVPSGWKCLVNDRAIDFNGKRPATFEAIGVIPWRPSDTWRRAYDREPPTKTERATLMLARVLLEEPA